MPVNAGAPSLSELDAANAQAIRDLREGRHKSPDVESDVGAFGQILTAIDNKESCSIMAVPSDSTGNDVNGEWVGLLVKWLAGRNKQMQLSHKLWNDTTQKYDPWIVQQTGTEGLGTRAIDFAWDGTNFSRTAYLPVANIAAHATVDIDVRCRIWITDWTPASTYVAMARYGSAGARCWYLMVNSAGYLVLSWSNDGTTIINANSTAPNTFTDGTANWIRATLDGDNGSAGYTVNFYTSSDGVTWTALGAAVTVGGVTSIFNSSTQEYEVGGRGQTSQLLGSRVYEAQIRNTIDGPIINPQPIDTWVLRDASGPNPGPTYWGTPTLFVINASTSGMGMTYFSDSTRLPLTVEPYYGALVFFSCQHNDADLVGIALWNVWDSYLASIKARLPGANFCVVTQNPQIAPRTTQQIARHAERRLHRIQWAQRNNIPIIDTYQAFIDDGRPITDLIVTDGVHPSAEGSLVWANAVAQAFLEKM